MPKDFCHLHVHTEYSLLDGIIRAEKLPEYVKELGMSACAITDHGNLFGAIEHYRFCKEAGIKPLLGCEVYLTFDKDCLENKDMERKYFHMGLIAMNKTGWENLLFLVSNAYLNNFYYKPRVSFYNLCAHSKGLIALSGCLAGLASRTGEYNQEEKIFIPNAHSLGLLQMVKDAFGDRFYAEIQDNAMWEQPAYNQWLLEQTEHLGVKTIITSDAHYMKPDDWQTHALIVAQQTKKTLAEYKESAEMQYGTGYYIRSPDEMYEAAARCGVPEAASNTLEVMERCNLDITLGEYETPVFDVTKCDDYQDFLRWQNERSND